MMNDLRVMPTMLILCWAAALTVAAPVHPASRKQVVLTTIRAGRDTVPSTAATAGAVVVPNTTAKASTAATAGATTHPTTEHPQTHGPRPIVDKPSASWLQQHLLTVAIGSAAAVFGVFFVVAVRSIAHPKLKITNEAINIANDSDEMSIAGDDDLFANGHSTPVRGKIGLIYE